jgi:uncharacterized protein with PQ loop repeat
MLLSVGFDVGRREGKRTESTDKRSDRMKRNCVDRMLCGALALGAIALWGCEGLSIQDTSSLLAPRLMRSEIVGLVAGFGTTFAAVPDLIVMFRRSSSKGMNPMMAGIMAIFQLVWIYYGLLIVSRPVIVWNMIAAAINGLNVTAYFHFARSERRRG